MLSLSLAACDRSGHAGLEWAQSAIARNASLELVAIDPATDTLTVRIRTTGEIRRVRADELVAALPGAGTDLSRATPPSPAATDAASLAAAPPIPAPGTSSAAAAESAAIRAAPPVATAAALESGSDTSDAGATAAAPEPRAPNPSRVASITPASADVSPAEPAAHKVVSGPGYSIAVVGAAAPAVSRDTVARNLPVEHRHEPIVCQGGRLMQIDNRNLEFDGDALAAEDGCDLHITNSRIAAQGIGVLARAARVHIENSAIEGEASSIEASEGAQVYVQSSTFKGVIHRVDSAGFHDLGGNVGN
jgi:hypothetical protein